MTELRNKRHEAFAKELARGRSASESYVIAGFSACRQNAHRLSSNDDVKKRVAELQSQREIDTKNGRDPTTGQFILGHNSNGGRPKGSRNKLGEQFLIDAYEEWKKSGPAALKVMAETDPSGFVRVIANILPAKVEQSLSVDIEIFNGARTFAEAYRIAREYITADKAKLIELEAEYNSGNSAGDGEKDDIGKGTIGKRTG